MEDHEDYDDHAATYCPEDNKLRLYPACRLDDDEYQRVKAAGFRWAGKQELFVCPAWSAAAEDLLLEMCGEIDDEDQTPQERAAVRADRFSGYRDKRRGEATGHADRYDSGPMVHGYQSAALAERRATRHDAIAGRAVTQWGKAEYWQYRTAGVISHALHTSTPAVRMGRIKRLESELRRREGYNTPDGSPAARYTQHLRHRLAYENAMLEASGGRAGELEMEPGGFLASHQIVKVNKSRATGRVVSVVAKGQRGEGWDHRRTDPTGKDYSLYKIEVERLPPGTYRAPTDEEREAFAAWLAGDKAKAKAAKKAGPKAAPLVNPTREEAERLQAIWNATGGKSYSGEPYTVMEMTQAEYSERAKGAYGNGKIAEITGGGPVRHSNSVMQKAVFPAVAKVRSIHGRSVVILTDKPQKALDAEAWADPRPAVRAEVLANWDTLLSAFCVDWADRMTDEQAAVFYQARLVGLAHYTSLSQFGLTEAGRKVHSERQSA